MDGRTCVYVCGGNKERARESEHSREGKRRRRKMKEKTTCGKEWRKLLKKMVTEKERESQELMHSCMLCALDDWPAAKRRHSKIAHSQNSSTSLMISRQASSLALFLLPRNRHSLYISPFYILFHVDKCL